MKPSINSRKSMNSDLMTSAICWEIGAKVSVEFAYQAKEFFYFCPEDNCLSEVVPAKINNVFFRAPDSHCSGCANEKRKTTESAVERGTISRKTSIPQPPIPSHLGPIARVRRGSKPTTLEMRELALRSRSEAPLHYGTLLEVVNAWCLMNRDDRQSFPLHIGHLQQSYFNAFNSLKHASKEGTLDLGQKILYGCATVKKFNHSFYVTTREEFKFGGEAIPIRIRIRSGDALFQFLKHNQEVILFLHGAIPELDKHIEINSPDAYSGMIVTQKDLSPLTTL